MPSIAITSGTKAAFSLMERPGARSIPKCVWATNTMLPRGQDASTRALRISRRWGRREPRSRFSRPPRRKRGERLANGIQVRATSGDEGGGGAVGIDLSCRGGQLRRGIVGHAALCARCKRRCEPLVAALLWLSAVRLTSSMFSSRLPFEHLGALAQGGHEVVHALHLGGRRRRRWRGRCPGPPRPKVGIGTEATCRMPRMPT